MERRQRLGEVRKQPLQRLRLADMGVPAERVGKGYFQTGIGLYKGRDLLDALAQPGPRIGDAGLWLDPVAA